MRIFKINPLLKIFNSYLIDSSQPSNLNYLWNFGSLLALSLVIQIITGVTLAMHYNASVTDAFNSVEHIMRDVNNGWLIRYLHSNTASAFFLIVYLHIGRGLYYGSYKAPRTLVWTIGTIIFILMMATAFLGFLTIAQNDHDLSAMIMIIITTILNFKTQKSYIRYGNYNKQLFTSLPFLRRSSSAGGSTRHSILYSQTKRHYSSVVSNVHSSLKGIEHSVRSKTLDDFIKRKNLNPVYVYDNLDIDSVRKGVLEDTRNLTGIYLILNKVNSDYYIGSASTGKIYTRFARHLLNLSGSKIVKNAVKKYKLSSFAFMVLELYPEVIDEKNNKDLLDLEDFYLKSLLPNYNILTEAGSSFGYKHSDLTRINMKANYSEQRRQLIGSLNRGKALPATTIRNMKQAALNRDKVSHSEQAIANMKKSSKPILVQNLDKSIYGEYPSIVEAAKALGCSVKTIHRSLKSPLNLYKGFLIVNYVADKFVK